MSLSEQQIKTALTAAVDPNTGKDFVTSKAVKNIKFDGDDVSFDIELGYPAKTQIDIIRKQVIAAVRTVPGIGNVSANVSVKTVSYTHLDVYKRQVMKPAERLAIFTYLPTRSELTRAAKSSRLRSMSSIVADSLAA